jgi:hypothetical protein
VVAPQKLHPLLAEFRFAGERVGGTLAHSTMAVPKSLTYLALLPPQSRLTLFILHLLQFDHSKHNYDETLSAAATTPTRILTNIMTKTTTSTIGQDVSDGLCLNGDNADFAYRKCLSRPSTRVLSSRRQVDATNIGKHRLPPSKKPKKTRNSSPVVVSAAKANLSHFETMKLQPGSDSFKCHGRGGSVPATTSPATHSATIPSLKVDLGRTDTLADLINLWNRRKTKIETLPDPFK